MLQDVLHSLYGMLVEAQASKDQAKIAFVLSALSPYQKLLSKGETPDPDQEGQFGLDLYLAAESLIDTPEFGAELLARLPEQYPINTASR